MVIGVSAGVGKSTFARKLGEILNITVFHLDAYYWKPGWVEASIVEFQAAQEKIVKKEEWIVEGNYTSTFAVRASFADTIIYLELPLYVCLYRVFKRWLMNIGKTRPDMGEGCKEKLDKDFLKFIITTYYPRKKTMMKRLQELQSQGSKKNIIILKNKKEIQQFLQDVERKASKIIS